MADYKLNFTAAEIDSKLGKIDSLANKTDVPTKTSDLTNDSGFATQTYVQNYAQPKGDYALRSELPEVPDAPVSSVNGQTGEVQLTAHDVGADPVGVAEEAISAHDASTTSHADIRSEIETLSTGVAYIDVTDNENVEIISHIDSELSETSENPVQNKVITNAISSLSAEKVDKNHGSSNVGKILIVGADGNLTLGDIPESISGDVIGMIDANNNIIITGSLDSGTYVFKYEGTDGTYSDIGSLVVGGVIEYSITTTLTNCTAASGNEIIITAGNTVALTFVANDGFALTETVEVVGAAYTWDASTGILVLSNPTADITITVTATKSGYTNIIDTVGYTDGQRPNSSGTTSALDGYTVTGLIDISAITKPLVVRTKGVNFTYSNSCYIAIHNNSGVQLSYNVIPTLVEKGGNYWNDITIIADDGGNLTITVSEDATFASFRIGGYGSGTNLIVTINEEITN